MARKLLRKAQPLADTDGEPSADTIRQALADLGIKRPFYTCRVVGNRLEFALYGGDVVYWPPKAKEK